MGLDFNSTNSSDITLGIVAHVNNNWVNWIIYWKSALM